MNLKKPFKLNREESALPVPGIVDNPAQSFRSLLMPIRNEIISMTDTSEQAFLSIGSRLREFYEKSKTATNISSDVAGLVSGEELMRGIGNLRGILDTIAGFQKQTRTMQGYYAASLRKIQNLSGNLYEPIRGLQEIAKNLRILSLTTKIQNATVGNSDSRFDLLAELVKQLTVTIDTKSMNILQRLKYLHTIIGQALSYIVQLESSHRGKSEQIMQSASSMIDSLIGKREVSSHLAGEISQRSVDIAESIGEVVSSIQFHDITRQQVEHVVETLGQLIANLESDGAKNEDERRMSILETVHISRLQGAQLRNSKNEFVGAVFRIIESLNKISRDLRTVLDETKKVHRGTDAEGSFLVEMERDLAKVSSALAALSENMEATDRLSEAIRSIIEGIGELTMFVTDMEHIENEIEVIALNAAIKAGQIGQKGAGLGLIAGRIQQLSRDTHQPTSTISQAILSVTSLSEELARNVQAKNGGGEMSNILGNLETLRSSFHGLHDRIQTCLTRMEEESESIITGLETITSGIRIHTSVASVLDIAISDLESAAAFAEKESKQLDPRGSMVLIENIRKRYTMERQRDIHTDQELIEQEKMKAMADDAMVRLASRMKKKERQLFGDNVELF